MMNDEKKKINDKKYNRKNTIIAIVGVVLIAILFITCIDVNAADYNQGIFIPFLDFSVHNKFETSTLYKVTLENEITTGDINIVLLVKGTVQNSFSLVTFAGNNDMTSTMTIGIDTNNGINKYNQYSGVTGVTLSYFTITIPDNVEVYGCYIYNYQTNPTFDSVITDKLNELNAVHYINNIIEISGNETYYINEYTRKSSYIFAQNNFYTDESYSIIIDGQVAVTSGISEYRLTVDIMSLGNLNNSSPDPSLSNDFINYVNNSGLNITDFNDNGRYRLVIDLFDYYGRDISVTINAITNDGETIALVAIPQVHVYQPEIDTETETETDTEEPDVPSIGDFEAGYAAAIRELAKTPLFGATVTGVMSYNENGEQIEVSRFEYVISKLTAQGGFSFKSLNGSIELIKEQNPDKDVYLSALQITFNREFLYENGLVLLGSNYNMPTYREGEYSAYWNPAITLSLSALNDVTRQFDAVLHNQRQTNLYNEFAYYYDFRFLSSFDDGRLLSIEFRDIIPDTFDAFINSAIYIPYSSYISIVDAQTYSYNQGWYDGRNSGLISDNNVSYQKGFAEGQKYKGDVEYENGYNKGLEDANSLRNVILAPFDGISNVMTGFLNVNILGFNLLDLIGGLLMALLVIWIAKKVM